MQNEQLVSRLNDKRMGKRLSALKGLLPELEKSQSFYTPITNINYVFRTVYSCFDRSPSLAVYYSEKFGMPLTAIVDYASLAATDELIKAKKITGGTYYCGAEVAVQTQSGKRIILSAVGVPHKNVKAFNDDLYTYRAKRLIYTNALREKLNARFKKHQISLPYDFWSFFGAIKTTSVEDLYVNLASKIIDKFQTGDKIIEFLTSVLGLELLDDENLKLADTSSTLYVFDLAYALKNKLVVKHPEEQLNRAEDFLTLCVKYGAISSATYKGGDLDEFLSEIVGLGVNSATAEFNAENQEFMQEFYDKCMQRGILPIIRTLVAHPRKKLDGKFTSSELAQKFNDNARCIVGHEISSSINPDDGMFTNTSLERCPSLEERIKLYSRIALK